MPQLEAKSSNPQTELRHLLRLQEQAFRRMGSKQQADDEENFTERKKAACSEADLTRRSDASGS